MSIRIVLLHVIQEKLQQKSKISTGSLQVFSSFSSPGTFLFHRTSKILLRCPELQLSVPRVGVIRPSGAGVNMWTLVPALGRSSYRAGILNHSWPGRTGGCRQADLVQCLTGCLLIYWAQQRYRNTIQLEVIDQFSPASPSGPLRYNAGPVTNWSLISETQWHPITRLFSRHEKNG